MPVSVLIRFNLDIFNQKKSTTTGAHVAARSLIVGIASSPDIRPAFLCKNTSQETLTLLKKTNPCFEGRDFLSPIDLMSLSKTRPEWNLIFVPYFDVHTLMRWRNEMRLPISVLAQIHTIFEASNFDAFITLNNYCIGSDGLIFPSESAKEIFVSFCQKNHLRNCLKMHLSVIGFGISTKRFRPATPSQKKRLRQRIDLDENKFVFLHMGRLNPFTKSDIFPLLITFHRLRKSMPNAVLIIAGVVHAKTYVDALQKYVKQHRLSKSVRFILDPKTDDLPKIYRLADCFVSLSEYLGETFGLSVVESMASGVPVLCSDLACYRSLIRPGLDGDIVPLYSTSHLQPFDSVVPFLDTVTAGNFYTQANAVDCQILAKKMLAAYQAPDENRRRSQNALTRARTLFCQERMVEAYIYSFREIVRNNRRKFPKKFPPGQATIWPSYKNIFTSYLDNETLFSLSPLGKQIVSGEENFTLFEGHHEKFRLIVPIMTMLSEKSPLDANSLMPSLGEKPEIIWENLMFLLKHDYIQILS